MCSTLEQTPAPVAVPALSRLVEHARAATEAVRAALAADPSLLGELPDELLEAYTLALHASVDAACAAATVVTGRLDRRVGSVKGKLVAGRYASTRAFLEREAGLAAAEARACVARGRDLDSHSTRVADAWLAGAICGGAVRDLTAGVSEAIRVSARTDTPVARDTALDLLMPVAARRDPRRLSQAVAELVLHLDPDEADERALAAFENQTLSLAEVGGMVRISGWLTAETAAATRTVLTHAADRIADQQVGGLALVHAEGCEALLVPGSGCTCGELARAARAAGLRHDQLLARALGEVMTDRLSDGALGTHHRVAPHLSVLVDAGDVAAPRFGRLAMPGCDDDVLVPPATVSRLLCDADVTRIVTSLAQPVASCGSGPSRGAGAEGPGAADAAATALVERLADAGRRVLYVGRAERTVPVRLRRALEARDQHCVFPGCRAHPRRCHAHHVVPWEQGGPTDLPNCALLCVAHHHAVHEGGWVMALADGATGHERGCWEFTPPPLRRRRLRP